VDVAKQLDERDAAHKAEIEQLKGRIAELLDEKEQSEGQLKKVQGLLVTSEADTTGAKAELQHLKEQATKWEVDIARLNADLAGELQILLLLPCPTYSVRHKTNLVGISVMPTHTHIPNIFFVFQASSLPLLKMLRKPCRWIG
jgi:DNA repair exonuclease SbcCD ATPase subunit